MGDFGDFKHVKTRKEHQCVFCGRTIPKGTKARNFSGLWEGDWQNWYTCGFCEREVENEYANTGEEISGDEFRYWLEESKHFTCPHSGNNEYRNRNGWGWIDNTHIQLGCGKCKKEWEVEIPIE